MVTHVLGSLDEARIVRQSEVVVGTEIQDRLFPSLDRLDFGFLVGCDDPLLFVGSSLPDALREDSPIRPSIHPSASEGKEGKGRRRN